MNCPNCKNPIENNNVTCEWCGFSLQCEEKHSSLDSELLDIIKTGGKLQAVKTHRKRTGVGLKESKKYVDELYAQNKHILSNKKYT
jgi:ribosomal protein L7/L12